MGKKVIIILFLISFLFVNTDFFIRQYYWKNISKHQITNELYFNDRNILLHHHKIYMKNDKDYTYKGTVILSFYKILMINNEKNQLCYYLNRGKITQHKTQDILPNEIILTKDTIIIKNEKVLR